MAYPPVNIINSTDYSADGSVDYRSAFCSDDNWGAGAHQSWTASGRGVCLVTKITATVHTNSGDVQATPYTSTGTSYSQFALFQSGSNTFEVTRRVTQTQDTDPEDYAEPTEKQK